MKKLSIFLLFLVTTLSVVAQDCPRIFQRGDTLFTDPARQYQWFKDNQPIQGATQQWYLPAKKGNFSVQVDTETIEFTYIPVSSNKSIAGRIVDEHYKPIADAVISIGNKEVKSDLQGRFILTGLEEDLTTAVVTITKTGCWKNTQRVHFFDQKIAPLTAMLEPLRIINRFDAQKGATISERGFFLTLPPNSAVTEIGQIYQGTIALSLKRSFPGEEGFGLRMPGGDFSAIDQNGQEKMLISYGFMSAEMQGANGEKLKLASDQEATLEFYIPWEQNKTAPDSMPLWYFDEINAVWRQEGTARKTGSRYVGTVKHFSSWNCDDPRGRATVRGKTANCNGYPIPHVIITVGQRVITTDENGEYTSFVPSDMEFEVTANVDTVKITPLVANEVRAVEDLAGSAILYAIGLIDSMGTLTIYGSGIEAYSMDGGKTFLPKAERLTFKENYPTGGIAKDSTGCQAKFRTFLWHKQEDCQLLDYLTLAVQPFYRGIAEAVSQKEPVFRLDLSNGLGSSLETLSIFPCLQTLVLSTNELRGLPQSIGQLMSLHELSLENNRLASLPESIGQLNNLRVLWINDNQLRNLPESIGQLNNLEGLYLNNNQLINVLESIGQLTKLQTLYLDNNRLTDVPEFIGQLSNLHSLSLHSNQLTSLPESIGNLRNLQWLDLYDNQLTSLPESIGQLINLQGLVLSFNQLKNVPQFIEQLTNLRTLTLESMQLTNVPEFIGQFSNLQMLSLSFNQLTNVPQSIGQLTNLQSLYFNNNQLTGLPESIANLKDSLEILDLSYNPIAEEELAKIRVWLPNTNIIY